MRYAMRCGLPALAVLSLALVLAGCSTTATGTTPVQLSFYSPLQSSTVDSNVEGCRLTLLFGQNKNIEGADIGLGVCQSAQMVGFANTFAANLVDGNFDGLEVAVGANVVSRHLEGVQAGAVYNRAKSARGVQLGLVNVVDDMNGVQFGLINIINNSRLPFFPFINIGTMETRKD